MPDRDRLLTATPDPRFFRPEEGQIVRPPEGWVLLPPGDAGLTRRVKAAGPTWLVQEKVGRKLFSRGLFAPALRVKTLREGLEVERADPAHERKLAVAAARRDRDQATYVQDFRAEVFQFLAFSETFADIGRGMADRVTALATPVGSGTVARTKRIGVDERAEAAVIAWLRHQTTAYDDMKIERVKGARRDVRRVLSQQSRALLSAHRSSQPHRAEGCALCRAATAP